jgi:hypothetical protein
MSVPSLLLQIVSVIAVTTRHVDCEIFTSTTHLQRLIGVESAIARHLKEYVKKEEARLAVLKR